MATLERAAGMWRQVKRVVSIAAFGAGLLLLWQLYTGGSPGPVMLFLGVLLTGGGAYGALFPSKVRVLNTRSSPD